MVATASLRKMEARARNMFTMIVTTKTIVAQQMKKVPASRYKPVMK